MRTHLALNGRVDVLAPGDHLLGGPETADLLATARDLAARGRHAVLIDLANVPYMNSLALGALARIVVTYSRAQGSVKVCNLGARVRKLFDIVRFNKLFEYRETEAAALEAFAREMESVV